MFTGQSGGLINPSYLRQRSFAAPEASPLWIILHRFRHACASLLFQRNVHPKIVHELLGHVSVAITLDTYSHVLPDMQDSAVDAIGAASEPYHESDPVGVAVRLQ